MTSSNKRARIVSVVGARPQFVKLAPLAGPLAENFHHDLIHTGQHYDDNMSRVFFRQLALPRIKCNLGAGGCSPTKMIARMLTALEKEFNSIRPDLVLVFGDTNSTLAGALAAVQSGIPLGHIEAGMRSYVSDMPEEINRKVTDHISQLLFCSNQMAADELRLENIRQGLVVSGDLMYEQLHNFSLLLKGESSLLKKYNLKPRDYLYLTIHRAATLETRENLQGLIDILSDISEPILWPLHPHTKVSLSKFRLLSGVKKMPHLHLIQPLSYVENLKIVKQARVVLTDSGGLQKEALFLKRPLLTLRDETEWRDTLKLGNRLVGLDPDLIRRSLKLKLKVKKPTWRIGNQRPSQIIVRAIKQFLRDT